MKHLKPLWKILNFTFFTICTSFILIASSGAVSERNSLTFVNQSGGDALVKLVGPSRRVVEVSNGSNVTVNIAGGSYCVFVRYGKGPKYRYTKGETFHIHDSATSYTEATLTLHGVINGNYHTYGSSSDEFNR